MSDADFRNKNEQQMVEYGTRMRTERDEALAKLETLKAELLRPGDLHRYEGNIHDMRNCRGCRLLATVFECGPLTYPGVAAPSGDYEFVCHRKDLAGGNP